jgi:hypothetical protein
VRRSGCCLATGLVPRVAALLGGRDGPALLGGRAGPAQLSGRAKAVTVLGPLLLDGRPGTGDIRLYMAGRFPFMPVTIQKFILLAVNFFGFWTAL